MRNRLTKTAQVIAIFFKNKWFIIGLVVSIFLGICAIMLVSKYTGVQVDTKYIDIKPVKGGR